MGVTGLWKLIEPCGKPVPVETLEGKILAVDVSIWLHQVIKGFQDSKGSALNNAHLLGLFHRLCKLLYFRVRPVFIFDGCVPQLKRDTIAKRQQQRSKLNSEADRIQTLLLQSLAKEKVVQQALGTNAELLLKSPLKRTSKNTRNEDAVDDIFKLPDLPATSTQSKQQDDDSDCFDTSICSYSDEYTSASATDSSNDESNARHTYNANLQAIDVRSHHFLDLPADVRHDILTDIKETRKQSSWGRLHELPSRSDDFAAFQMKRLLKRRAVQESLEQAQQEMGGHTLTYAELNNFFNEEGIVTPSAFEQRTKPISSDENTRFLLVRDLKKKFASSGEAVVAKQIKCDDIKEEPEKKPTNSAKASPKNDTNEELKTEYDTDLDLAIALSLEESKVYDEKDYDYDSDQDLKLNREQSKQLKNAAKGPARAYMIEYGGMNVDEVENIMEETQVVDLNNTQYLNRLLNIENAVPTECQDKLENTQKEGQNSVSECNSTALEQSQELDLRVSDNSDTDTDLEEVVDEHLEAKETNLKIVLDLKEPLAPEDDLFADIFDDPATKPEEEKDNIDQKSAVEKYTSDENKNYETQISESKSVAKFEGKHKQLAESGKSKPPIALKSMPDNTKIVLILDELKKQANEIKNINLESIKLNHPSVIEISDDEIGAKSLVASNKKQEITEVIEICDSDDNQKPVSSLLNSNIKKSPEKKTPSKNKTITEFFEINYLVKRTPDKPQATEGDSSPVPKVKSPFFVYKTPKSGRKRNATNSNSPSPEKKPTKAAKTLFKTQDTKGENDDFQHISEMPNLTAEDVIKEAAETLKAQKTDDELKLLANELGQERRELEAERNRQDRMGMSISQRMVSDCQELLRLFGIPFIVAPMEAEAQCAFLNAMELTNGTITDDSDIWLFGGRTVYKNFFAQNKNVLEFRADQIEKSFNCDRKKLIQLACLVGSDYTTGVHGIGAVTALEILASFSSGGQESPLSKEELTNRVTMHAVLSTLVKFRNWWQANGNSSVAPGSTARLSLRKKLKNIELNEGFPNIAVVEAYLAPKVDENKESFTWGFPDVESIREFARKTFGWTTSKTDDILMPVIKKLSDKKTQGSIRNYFAVKNALSLRQLKVSKRVQTAIDKMSGKIDSETPEKPAKPKRTKGGKRKAANAKGHQDIVLIEEPQKEAKATCAVTRGKRKNATQIEVSTEEGTDGCTPVELSTKPSTIQPRKLPRLPEMKDFIPQRESDLEKMRKNKEKAIEIMSKSRATEKKSANA